MKKTYLSVCLSAIALWMAVSPAVAAGEGPNLLMYCGVTMVGPIQELANEFQKSHGCTLEIKPGGSGNLLNELASTKRGDLFLPGSDSYIQRAEKKGLIGKNALVGYNKAAIMVQKGNPKGIPADLNSLIDPSYRVVIGNPKSGSIGQETKKILDSKGIYDQVVARATDLATASKTLVEVLKNDQADITINWFATSTWEANSRIMDALPIDESFASKKKLILAVLPFSENMELSEAFLDLVASEHGKEIFNRYGLYDVK